MIVPDTSAWVEYLRGSDHPVSVTLTALLEELADIMLTECVFMEVMAGARTQREAGQIRSVFAPFPTLVLDGRDDYEEAARIYRSCRAAGRTLRSQVDCLIAVPVIKASAMILHNDSDFDAIARHTELRIYPVDAE